MATEKFTKSVVDGIAPSVRDVMVWDSQIPGFGGRVRAGGSKTFIAQYRAGGGRCGTSRRFTLGRYGTIKVDEARDAAMTGALLGHADSRSTSIYAHMQNDPVRQTADRVVAPIATALGLSKPADVIPLPPRKATG